jgi:hypothetical protein
MIQTIFNYIFILEAVFKGIAFGNSYFNYGWNKFDFFIVSSSVLDMSVFSNPNLNLS